MTDITEMLAADEDDEPQKLPDDPRQRFTALLEQRGKSKQISPERIDEMRAEFEAEVIAAVKAKHPRSRPKIEGEAKQREQAIMRLGKKLGDEFEAIKVSWVKRIEAEQATVRERYKELDEQLGKLADTITPCPGDEWVMVHSVNSTTFNSQGLGRHRYAEACAEQFTLNLLNLGIESEVRKNSWQDPESEDEWKHKTDIADYEVWVKCDPLEWEIVMYKPAVPLKDWLMWCRMRGVNPRVLRPLLPHGIEEKLLGPHPRDQVNS